MAPERRKLLLLAALIVALAAMFALRVRPGTTTATLSTSNTRGRDRTTAAAQVTAPDVHLEALECRAPQTGRNRLKSVRFPTGTACQARPRAATAVAAAPRAARSRSADWNRAYFAEVRRIHRY